MYSKYPVTHVWLVSTLLMGFCLFLLYFFSQIVIFAILIGLVVISMTLHSNTTAIILRHSSTLENIGKIQGYYYTFKNIGWVVGPLISSFILYKYGLLNNFLAIGFFIFAGWLLFLYYQIKAYEENKSQTITLKSIRQNIVDYFRNKELFKLYFLRGALSLYWSVFYIFTPLYIIYNSLSISFVGLFLGIATIPIVVAEYLIAKKIDVVLKRELFITGSFLISLFLLLAFIFSSNIYVSLAFILLSIVGAGFLEPTCETYFFNNVNQFIADKYYGVYRTSDTVFSLSTRLFFGFILLFLKIKFIYLFTALFFILIFFIARNIKN